MTTAPPAAPDAASSATLPQAAPQWRRIAAQAAFETKLTLRHGEQLLLSMVLPILILVGLSAFPLLKAFGVDLHGLPPVDFAFPGVIALSVVSSAFTGQAIATGFDRRYGVLRLLATTPLGKSGLLGGKVLSVFAVEVVQLIVLGIIACILGWRQSWTMIVPGLVAILLGSAAFVALGLLIAGTLRAEATLAGANLIWVLLLAGGGLVLPASAGVAKFVGLLPSGALGDSLRAAAAGHYDLSAFIILAVWAALAGAALMKWFKWGS